MPRVKHTQIRKKIEEESKGMTWETFSSSSAYSAYLLDIAINLSKRYRLGSLQVICSSDLSKLNGCDMACTDNQTVYIYSMNSFTEEYHSWEAKHYSILGLLLHEVGHLIFTDFETDRNLNKEILFHKNLDLSFISNPILSDSAEKFNELIRTQNNQNILFFIIKEMQDLMNCMEDGFVNESICKLFPGFAPYLLQNSLIQQDGETSFGKMLTPASGKPMSEYFILRNMVLSYSLFGEVNIEPEYSNHPLVQQLDALMPHIDHSLLELDSKTRQYVQASIFTLIFPYLEKLIKEDIEKNNGNENTATQDMESQARGASQNAPSRSRKPSNCTNAENRIAGENAPDLSNSEPQNTSNSSDTEDGKKQNDEDCKSTNSSHPEQKPEDLESKGSQSCETRESDEEASDDSSEDGAKDSKKETSAADLNASTDETQEVTDNLLADESTRNSKSDINEETSSVDNKDTIEKALEAKSEHSPDNENNDSGTDSPNEQKSESSDENPEDEKESEDSESNEKQPYVDQESVEEVLNNSLTDESNEDNTLDMNEERTSADSNDPVDDAPEENDDTIDDEDNGSVSDSKNNPKRVPLSHKKIGDTKSHPVNLDLIKKKIVDTKVELEMEKELKENLRNIPKYVDFPSIHRDIPCSLNRNIEITDTMMKKYDTSALEYEKLGVKIAREFEKIEMQRRRGKNMNALLQGRQLDTKRLYRRDGHVFRKRCVPGNNHRIRLGILIDESGSMSGTKIAYATAAAIALYTFAVEMDIDAIIYGHSTSGNGVCLNSYTEPDSVDKNDKYRLMNISSSGSNRDGYALRFMYHHLLEEDAETYMMIIISDGLPSHGSYRGQIAETDLKSAVMENEELGVITIAAGIDSAAKDLKRIYGDYFMNITNLDRLPRILVEEVEKQLIKK